MSGRPSDASLEKPASAAIPQRTIEYLSPLAEVSMSDGYFEIASLGHFWVQRRFEVFCRLAGDLVVDAREMAEIGCGHGMLQRQIEVRFKREVTGFDLNEHGLKRNLSERSKVCCYDIFQMEASLRERFDLIFLFDVLEHVPDEDGFLKALIFHLATNGKLIVNVPAGPSGYSGYDRAAGHFRRYSSQTLRNATERNNLEIVEWSYWGLPLLPTLILRKLWDLGSRDPQKAYSAGFNTRAPLINELLGFIAKCEVIPQKLGGTSLMAVLQREAGREKDAAGPAA